MTSIGKQIRNILVIVGSDSDLPQCIEGLKYLLGAEERGIVKNHGVYTLSCHRHGPKLRRALKKFARLPGVKVIVAAAGMAAHLPGICDSELRYAMENVDVYIIGVAMAGKTEIACTAALTSISQVPKTQVIFRRDERGSQFFSDHGFFLACVRSVEEELPPLHLPAPVPSHKRTVRGALRKAEQMQAKNFN
jgi:phosphoribosylcarboxyaminoimidazole (NCAIR) mutase